MIPDRHRLLTALREGSQHTFDIRARMGIGNPSERRRDLEAEGHTIHVARQKRGDRWGARYTLVHDAEGRGTQRAASAPAPGAADDVHVRTARSGVGGGGGMSSKHVVRSDPASPDTDPVDLVMDFTVRPPQVYTRPVVEQRVAA